MARASSDKAPDPTANSARSAIDTADLLPRPSCSAISPPPPVESVLYHTGGGLISERDGTLWMVARIEVRAACASHHTPKPTALPVPRTHHASPHHQHTHTHMHHAHRMVHHLLIHPDLRALGCGLGGRARPQRFPLLLVLISLRICRWFSWLFVQRERELQLDLVRFRVGGGMSNPGIY
eukprot:313106-Rhodomonas_salina.1